jgi:hypothetical protein
MCPSRRRSITTDDIPSPLRHKDDQPEVVRLTEVEKGHFVAL